METGIHFARTILKLLSQAHMHHSAQQTTLVFVVSSFVLGLQPNMDVVQPKKCL